MLERLAVLDLENVVIILMPVAVRGVLIVVVVLVVVVLVVVPEVVGRVVGVVEMLRLVVAEVRGVVAVQVTRVVVVMVAMVPVVVAVVVRVVERMRVSVVVPVVVDWVFTVEVVHGEGVVFDVQMVLTKVAQFMRVMMSTLIVMAAHRRITTCGVALPTAETHLEAITGSAAAQARARKLVTRIVIKNAGSVEYSERIAGDRKRKMREKGRYESLAAGE